MLSTLRNTLLRNRSAFTQTRAMNLATARRAFFSQGPKPEEAAAPKEATNTQAAQEVNPEQVQQAKVEEKVEAKPGFMDSISKKVPMFGKVADFVVESIRETFPSDQYLAKAEQARKEAKLMNEKQQAQKEYTEEELSELQENIPEWKRTSMVEFADENAEKPSLKSQVSNKIKEKFNETEFARYLYNTEQYKEYEDFKKEMSQFKEDYKDHLSQSQNPALIASMALYGKVTSESNTSQAINEMRKYTRGFDIFDLERDARGIFCDAFNAYLKGDLTYIEKTCEDAGLAYFKTMLKQREVAEVFPKYTEIWESEQADLVGGRISERNMPCFTFSVRIQEIHCNISKKTNKVVDGTDDNLLQRRFNVVLSPHENPDIESVGHKWSIIEVMPVEATPMLA